MKVKQIIFLLLMISFVSSTGIGADFGVEGVDVLTRYLSALSRGDTDEARSLMGGELLQKRRRLFNNPEYRKYLVERYKNAHLEILGVQYLDNNKINVSVRTQLENGDRFTSVYTIARESGQSALIIAESRPHQR